jgi:hypothetical protein
MTAGIIGILVVRSASSSTPSFGYSPSPEAHRVAPGSPSSSAPWVRDVPRGDPGRATTDAGAVSKDDGVLPEGVTPFDDEYPGIANLDGDLLMELREATMDAADAGVDVDITSGWRSPAYQDELLRAAVSQYGSLEEAERWVAAPDTSPHVSGDAVDIGPAEAAAWLSDHGAGYGLCQIYRNEPWHYELRPRAIERGCPRMYPDPTRDPRMQR